MAQIIPRYNLGDRIGQHLQDTMSPMLNKLATHKLDEMFQRHEQNRIGKARSEGRIDALPEWQQKMYYSMFPERLIGGGGQAQYPGSALTDEALTSEALTSEPLGQEQAYKDKINAFSRSDDNLPQDQQAMTDKLNQMLFQSGFNHGYPQEGLPQVSQTLAPQAQGNDMQGPGAMELQKLNLRQRAEQQRMQQLAKAQQGLQDYKSSSKVIPTSEAHTSVGHTSVGGSNLEGQLPEYREAGEKGFNLFDPKQRKEWTKFKQARQEKIENRYKKYSEKLDKALDNDSDIAQIADDALQLIATGDTREGLKGLLPVEYTGASDATRELDRKYNLLVAKEAGKLTGILTGAKIALTKGGKPSLNQSKETQIEILKDIKQKAETGGIALSKIAMDIKEANGGQTPENFDNLVKREYMNRYPNKFPGSTPGLKSKIKQLDNDTVDKLLRQTGNDPVKARELAVKMGYKV